MLEPRLQAAGGAAAGGAAGGTGCFSSRKAWGQGSLYWPGPRPPARPRGRLLAACSPGLQHESVMTSLFGPFLPVVAPYTMQKRGSRPKL